jgi:hypothetical protein
VTEPIPNPDEEYQYNPEEMTEEEKQMQQALSDSLKDRHK